MSTRRALPFALLLLAAASAQAQVASDDGPYYSTMERPPEEFGRLRPARPLLAGRVATPDAERSRADAAASAGPPAAHAVAGVTSLDLVALDAAVARMSVRQGARVRARCAAILAEHAAYDEELVNLCSLLAAVRDAR